MGPQSVIYGHLVSGTSDQPMCEPRGKSGFFFFLFFPKNLYRQLTTIVNKSIKYMQATDVSKEN